jgi:hypothetical protein
MTGNGAQGHNIATTRQLLLAAFTPEDLHRFCLDDPRVHPICDRFDPGHSLNDMIDQVIDHCRPHRLRGDSDAKPISINQPLWGNMPKSSVEAYV